MTNQSRRTDLLPLVVVAVNTWRQLVTTDGITPKKKTKRYKIVGSVVLRQHTIKGLQGVIKGTN